MDLEIRTSGRARKRLDAEVVRALDPADLVLTQAEKGSKPNPIKRISERHHSLARNLAGGMEVGEAAIICGYDISRVSILQSDPTFKELIAFYRRDVSNTYRGMHERLAGVSLDALDELQSRLEDTPEQLSVGQLIEITKMGSDRTGHGPSNTTTNVNVNVDLANRLEAARKRVADRRTTLIEGTVNA